MIPTHRAGPAFSFAMACLLALAAGPPALAGCANRAAAHPVTISNAFLAERGGFEPPVRFPARMFSKHVVSATHPPLHVC